MYARLFFPKIISVRSDDGPPDPMRTNPTPRIPAPGGVVMVVAGLEGLND
jgi:hypothetical protein